MKEFSKIICTVLIITLFTSCKEEFALESAIKRSGVFFVGHFEDDQIQIVMDTIYRGTAKWHKLLEFGKVNETGWSSSSASYNFDYWGGPGTFRLSGWRNGTEAVLSYSDQERGITQLTKDISPGELDFLIE